MTGEDGAEETCTEHVHDGHCVPWLFGTVDFANPGREGQNTVAGHGEDETGGGDDRYTSTLGTGKAMSITERQKDATGLTKIKPNAAIIVMKTLGPLPSAIAYSCTKGWGASKEKRVSKSGVQNKKRIVVRNPMIPVASALVKIPRPAITL